MEASKIIFVLNPSTRLIKASYEPIATAGEPLASAGQGKEYLFKTLDQQVAVDDFVIVQTNTRHGLTICKVTAVDLDVDLESPLELKWAFGAVHMQDIQRILDGEREAIAKVQSVERRKKTEELRRAMMADHENEFQGLALMKPIPSDDYQPVEPPSRPG